MDVLLMLGGLLGVAIGFISLIFPLKFLGIRTRKNGAIVVLVSFVLFVSGVLLLDQNAVETTTTSQAQADQPATVSVPPQKADKTEEYRQAVLSFERAISQGEAYARSAMKQVEEASQKFAVGQATAYDVYVAARKAREACEQTRSTILRLDVPKELPNEVQALLKEARDQISTAYMLRTEQYKALMAFIDEQKYSYADEAESKKKSSDEFIMRGALALVNAKIKVGIDITE